MLNLPHTQALAKLCPVRRYLEIGVQEGASLRAVVEASPQLEELVLCDTWGTECGGTGRGSNAHIEKLLKELGYTGRVIYLEGASQQLIPAFLQTQPPLFDLVFVDRHHGEQEALTDLRNVWPIANRLAVHDLVFPEVLRACFTWMSEQHSTIHTVSLASVDYNGMFVIDRKPV